MSMLHSVKKRIDIASTEHVKYYAPCMKHHLMASQARSGFTLIELSVVLAIIGVILYGSMSLLIVGVQTSQVNSTVATMDAIENALLNFRAAFGRLPCPADLTATTSSANYGVEAANAGSCTGGSPAANFIAASGAAEGSVPTRALRLSDSYMYDGWGHKFRYAVEPVYTASAASSALCTPITVNDASGSARSSAAIYALVSHGANGHGAYTSNGSVINAGSTNTDEQKNCHCDSTAAHTGGAGVLSPVTYVQKAPTIATAGSALTTFDDIVTHKEAWQMMMPLLKTNSFSPPVVTAPANSTYASGNTLTFTLTYPSSVTITGTPRLDLSALGSGNIGTGNVAYATYQSGSGTPTLTFSYTVQSTDSAPTSGLSMTSNLDLNGGTISGGMPCFTAPNLSGVLIAATAYVYIADAGHNRVVVLDTSGNFKFQLGCASGNCSAGSGTTQFNDPQKVVIDSSGNIYVSDTNNNKIKVFNSSGTYVTYFDGSPSHTINSPQGIAIDSSNNIWVVDQGNMLIMKFTSGGSYLTGFTYAQNSSPSPGQFNSSFGPEGAAVDSNGNVWITCYNKYWLQEFNGSTSAYVTNLGSAGSGSGQIGSTHYPATDSSGNIYIPDDTNGRVDKFNANTLTYVNSFAGGTKPYFSGHTAFNTPHDISVDSSGNIWVVDQVNNNVQEFNSAGVWIQTITTFNSGQTFSGPTGVTVTR